MKYFRHKVWKGIYNFSTRIYTQPRVARWVSKILGQKKKAMVFLFGCPFLVIYKILFFVCSDISGSLITFCVISCYRSDSAIKFGLFFLVYLVSSFMF